MAWWAKIFGSSEAINKGLDMVDRGVDMAVFTGEEKSIASQKVLDWKLEWLKALGPQSKARRYITYLVAGLWVYLVALMVHLHLLGYKAQAEYIFKVLAEVVSTPFSIVIAFYFLANVVRANKK